MYILDTHIHISKMRKKPVQEIISLMDEYGINQAVVFPGNEIEPDNRWMVNMIRNHRDRMIPFAWLNPLTGNKAVEELKYLVEKEGFRGVKFHPLFHSFFPNRPLVDSIAKQAIEYDIPILVHCGHAPYSTPWQVGEFAEMYPKLTVILDHMGLQVGWVDDAISVAERNPNIILGTTANVFHEKIRMAVEKIGEDRVIYGSDAPTIHPLPEIERVKVAGLSPNVLEKVMGLNARRILKLK